MTIHKQLYITAIASFLIACNNNPKPQSPITTTQPINKIEVVDTIIQQAITPQPRYNYHVIAGCFMIPSNARNLMDKLNDEGFQATIIPFGHNRELVSFGAYATFDEAQKTLNKITYKRKLKGLWIYDVSGNTIIGEENN